LATRGICSGYLKYPQVSEVAPREADKLENKKVYVQDYST
jgi:hypothetical protein